ncbi:Maf-like protein [Leucogyrophana mollusca]|uniref:Maf-like protein n=1 Tax=Leucogyrophana mollusca TaxID=85980 RepID=A0ACB8BS61_9AGAM|nr:Maf-like protein [Leucogyrophana mollusca]
MSAKHNAVLPNALKTAAVQKLVGKRIILASASPRRKDILQNLGLAPEIIPSTFGENLPVSSFEDIHEYPVATATHKAVEVYERLVSENPDDAPDLVIGADTVVLTHALPANSVEMELGTTQELLEKPVSKEDNLRMLLDLNGGVCEVVTGVSLGAFVSSVSTKPVANRSHLDSTHGSFAVVVYPVLSAPGYEIRSLDERTLVYFADNPAEVLNAYAESGEGIDRAGGFAVQGLGNLLIRKVDGDYSNVVGFPGASFFKLLDVLVEEEEDFLGI